MNRSLSFNSRIETTFFSCHVTAHLLIYVFQEGGGVMASCREVCHTKKGKAGLVDHEALDQKAGKKCKFPVPCATRSTCMNMYICYIVNQCANVKDLVNRSVATKALSSNFGKKPLAKIGKKLSIECQN